MTHFKSIKVIIVALFYVSSIDAQEIDPSIISQFSEQQLLNIEESFERKSSVNGNSIVDTYPKAEETLIDEEKFVFDDQKKINKFGYNFFNLKPSSVLAVGDLPLPNDYKISLKDKFTIILSGSKDSIFDVEVKLDGTILFPEIGSISVAGLSLNAVREKLKKLVAQKFIGVELDVSLSSLSAKKVTIVGAVNTPGTYLVNPFSTITSALNYSGGIKENGSLRKIKLIKNNGKIHTFDLYEYLIFGNRSQDQSLDAGDTILIEGTDNFVEVSGSVMRPMIYEVVETDKLNDLIGYALGFKRTSNKSKISISSLDVANLRINQIDTDDLNYPVNNAIRVDVFDYMNNEDRGILVKGAVKESGYYDFNKYKTLVSLINELSFVDVYPFFSIIEQFDKENYKQQTRFFSLNDPATYNNINLGPNTKVYFIGLNEFENFSSKFISSDVDIGDDKIDRSMNVNESDDVSDEDIELILDDSKTFQETSDEDLEQAAFKERYDINLKTYELMKDYELTINHDENIYHLPVYGSFRVDSIVNLVGLDLSDVPNFEATYISPLDNIVEVSDYRLMTFIANKFHNLSFKTSQNNLIKVYLYGAVEFPGEYTLSENSTLQDLYDLTGQFKSYANANAIILRRESIKQQQIKSILRTKSELKAAILSTSMQSSENKVDSSVLDNLGNEIDEDSLGRIAGIFSPNSQQSIKTILENNDSIFVPKISNTISVVGEVMNPNAFVFEDGITFKEAVYLAGGYRESADKRGAYIIKENGLIYKPGSNIFISNQDVSAGDTIVIPTKIIAQNSTMDIVNSLTAILSQISFSAAAIDSLRKN